MRYFIIIVSLFLLNSSYILSQECELRFIEDVIEKYKTIQYDEIVCKTLKDSLKEKECFSFDSLKTTYIPSINFDKKVLKLDSIVSYKLLCYLNTKKLYFDNILVFHKKSLCGLIIESASNNNYVFLNKNDLLTNIYTPLGDEILKIEPDFVFRIYNLPLVYWYIKNKKLYALSYQQNKNEMVNFQSYDAKFYIDNYITEKDIIYLKKVKIVTN